MKFLRKLPLALGAAALFAAVLTGCASGAATGGGEAGKVYELVLLHTNDHHGAILPAGDSSGGLAERATFIKAVREANPNVLLVDAGDINTGSALSNMFAGEADIRAYNLMRYDVGTFGNHEFDKDLEKLESQIELADFPFVCSNIKTADGNFLGGHQYLVKDYEGFRVGIFGITTLRTLITSMPDKSLTFINEIEAARTVVDILKNREKADIIIGITHIGDQVESPDHVTSPALAEAVPGIDIIVDGHTHTYMESALKAGNTWIVSANQWGKYVGRGILQVADGKLVNFNWMPVEINTAEAKPFAPDPVISALIAPYKTKADASLKEVIGEAADTFVLGNRLPRYQETALGNMITDANVWYFRNVSGQPLDFAFHNGGNMRAELPRGKLTREHILSVLPFENYLYIVSLKGTQIQDLFNYIATIPQGNGGFPQFSKEVRYTIDIPGKTISNLTIGGAPVDPNKTYRFCTNDYLLQGGDGYTVLTKSENPFNTSLLLSYVVIEYIASQNGIISPSLDGRMTVTGGVTP